jgi:hypothetical protein
MLSYNGSITTAPARATYYGSCIAATPTRATYCGSCIAATPTRATYCGNVTATPARATHSRSRRLSSKAENLKKRDGESLKHNDG